MKITFTRITALLLICVMLGTLTACLKQGGTASTKYANCPVIYESVLDSYSEGLDAALSDKVEEEYKAGKFPCPTEGLEEKWQQMFKDSCANFPNVDKQAFGYIITDMNGDTNPELILMRSDYFTLAVLTVVDDSVILLDAYNNSYRCIIKNDSRLHTIDLTDGANLKFAKKIIAPNTGVLVSEMEFGRDGGVYYELIDGIIYSCPEDRYNELFNANPFQEEEDIKKLHFNVMK